MTGCTDEGRRVLAYLRNSADRGEGYFWARNTAEAIGLTAEQVGSRPP